MKQVSAIDRLQAHTELKHRGGGTATENMSILLFRKRGTAGRLKANQHGYRPRQASPVNCAQRVEQNNKKKHLWALFYWPLTLWLLPDLKRCKRKGFQTHVVHALCKRSEGPRQSTTSRGPKLHLCHPSHLSAKTFNRVGGITEAALRSSEVRGALRDSVGLGQKGPAFLN